MLSEWALRFEGETFGLGGFVSWVLIGSPGGSPEVLEGCMRLPEDRKKTAGESQIAWGSVGSHGNAGLLLTTAGGRMSRLRLLKRRLLFKTQGGPGGTHQGGGVGEPPPRGPGGPKRGGDRP